MTTLIGVPCFDMVHEDFAESMIDLLKPEGTRYTVVRNTLVHDARNIIAANAIEAGFERVMWIDSDMKLPRDALVKLAADMDETGADLISGLYFTRRYPKIKPVAFKRTWYDVKDDGSISTGADFFLDYPEGLSEIEAAGMGCCLMTVDLIKRVGENFGSPFQPLESMGEDIAFCIRAKKLGARMLLDSRVKCGHMGVIEYNEALYRMVNGIADT